LIDKWYKRRNFLKLNERGIKILVAKAKKKCSAKEHLTEGLHPVHKMPLTITFPDVSYLIDQQVDTWWWWRQGIIWKEGSQTRSG
jgi:hypothetical protein